MLFLVPTVASFWFSLTRWDLFTAQFIGLDNFRQFFSEPFLLQGLVNTLIYAVVTSGTKIVLGLLLAVLLTSGIFARGFLRTVIFFPVLVSTIGVGITFTVLMHPTRGAINETLEAIGIDGPGLADRPVARALLGRAGRCLEGRRARDGHLHRRPRLDQPRLLRGGEHRRRHPLADVLAHHPAAGAARDRHGHHPVADRRPALVRPDLGDDPRRPGFSSDVLATVIYKQYQAGFYGLSTAGNVILFLLIAAIILPLTAWFNRREVEL